MKKLVGAEITGLIEAVVRLENFRDTLAIAKTRAAVSALLKNDGKTLPRGKRTAPGLKEMVRAVTPLLFYAGLSLASSERSKLIRALRTIADELDLKGDPRDEIRRLIRVGNADTQAVCAVFLESIEILKPPAR